MKKMLALFSVLVFFLSLPADSEKELLKNLPPRYHKWLTQEVVYIIAPREKDVFLQLTSDLERDSFIKSFWKQRDPNPYTPENEFQIEHARRIAYANNFFGKDSPGPGWRTDQGRVYIQLGAPRSIEKMENETGIYPMVVWYYQGLSESGLPSAFNVVFFQKGGAGEFELYTPIRFGPQYLLSNYTGEMTSFEEAYAAIYKINPTIAGLSLNLIPGEGPDYSPSMASEMLINIKIPQAPIKKVNTLYAEKMLRYKDMVEMDYSANYIASSKTVLVVRSPASGNYFVHYLIEPKKLTVEQVNDKFFATLEISGNVSDAQNRPIFQINKLVPIELSGNQMEKIKDKLFSFQDMFPLIPGKFKLTVLLKNTVSKEFTSIESDIEIPDDPPQGIGSLLVANKLIENSSYKGQSKPFLIGDRQLLPSPRNDFVAKDTLYLFCQLSGLSAELKTQGSLQFDILNENVNVLSLVKKIGEYSDFPDILEMFPLAALKPANYTLRVTLLSPEKKALAIQESYFYITPMASLPRPWVVSVPLSSSKAPQYLNELGNQYWKQNRLEKARPLLEQAFHLSPQTAKFAFDLGRILLDLKEYARVKDIAYPLLKNANQYELALILAQAAAAQNQYGEAVDYFQQYIAHFPGTANILNALGDCYLGLGNAAEAQKAWEKSLALNPNQPGIKEKVAGLKNKSK